MQLTPTIYFQGNCADALSYYRDAIGAEILFQVPFRGNVDPQFLKPEMADKILRAGLRIGESVIYLSDGHCDGPPSFQGFSLTVKLASFDEALRMQQVLAEDRPIRIPLTRKTWTGAIGTALDRFGVHWMIEVADTPKSAR
jgi:PhnB protein